MPTQMTTDIKNAVRKYIDMASAIYGIKFEMPTIVEMKKASTTAGYAYYTQWAVHFNHKLFAITPDMLDDTVGHEVAHLVAYRKFNSRGHCIDWKNVMISFGLAPNRTFTLAPEAKCIGKNTTVHVFECNQCGNAQNFGPKRYKRSNNGCRYRHTKCGGLMVYQSTTTKHDQVRASQGIIAPKIVQKPAPQLTPKLLRNPSSTTKAQAVTLLISRHINEKSSDIIKTIMANCDMTKAGASTYYYKYR